MAWHLNRIPKKAFFYWGTEVLPWIRYLSMETFRKHHLDWEIFLYVKPLLDVVDLEKKQLEDNCWDKLKGIDVQTVEMDVEKELNITLPVKYITIYADLFRYIVLSRFGGFYVDTDMLFFKSLEDSPFNKPENTSYDVLMLPPPYHHFMLGVKDATWWKKVQQVQLQNLPKLSVNALATTAASCWAAQDYGDRILILPMESCEENFNANGPVNENAIALNWHGSGGYPKYRLIREHNYMELDHPLAACVRYCLTGNIGKPSGIGTFTWIAKHGDI